VRNSPEQRKIGLPKRSIVTAFSEMLSPYWATDLTFPMYWESSL